MSVVKRGILLLGVFLALLLLAELFSVQYQKRAVTFAPSRVLSAEAQRIELPASVIRGDYGQILLRQQIARALFVEQVERKQYLLVNIQAGMTDDGFVVSLEPVFAPITLQEYQKEHVAVFFSGEDFIEKCFPSKIDACMRGIVGRDSQVKRIYTNPLRYSQRGPSKRT